MFQFVFCNVLSSSFISKWPTNRYIIVQGCMYYMTTAGIPPLTKNQKKEKNWQKIKEIVKFRWKFTNMQFVKYFAFGAERMAANLIRHANCCLVKAFSLIKIATHGKVVGLLGRGPGQVVARFASIAWFPRRIFLWIRPWSKVWL